MNDLKENLLKAKALCDGMNMFRHEFCWIYSFATENVSEYMKYFDFHNKSLLTVGSSGDQILNAYYNGARDLTLFDINEYAKYYVYLKIAGIICLSYTQFQEFFFKHGIKEYENNLMFSKSLFKKMKSTLKGMDYDSFYFFDELFNSFSNNDIRNRLFDDDEYRNRVIRGFNVYLQSEDNYNKLKFIIKTINFNYINGNIFEDNIDGKYDNIFLSNLCTVRNIYDFYNLVKKIDDNNLKSGGSMLLAYLWDLDFNSDSYEVSWKDMYKMPIVKTIYKDFISEHYGIKNDTDILFNTNRFKDLVLIYRKK